VRELVRASSDCFQALLRDEVDESAEERLFLVLIVHNDDGFVHLVSPISGFYVVGRVKDPLLNHVCIVLGEAGFFACDKHHKQFVPRVQALKLEGDSHIKLDEGVSTCSPGLAREFLLPLAVGIKDEISDR
jgi:hypothetical protein